MNFIASLIIASSTLSAQTIDVQKVPLNEPPPHLIADRQAPPEAFNCISLPAGIGGALGFAIGVGACGGGCCLLGVVGATSVNDPGAALFGSSFAALIGAGVGGVTLGLAGGIGGALIADDESPKAKKKKKKAQPKSAPPKTLPPPQQAPAPQTPPQSGRHMAF